MTAMRKINNTKASKVAYGTGETKDVNWYHYTLTDTVKWSNGPIIIRIGNAKGTIYHVFSATGSMNR